MAVRLQHLMRAWVACARDFCLTNSMHGFIHIAAPGRSWLERVLWACACAAAIVGAAAISLDQWQRFNDNPTVVALEKDFRSWRFSLPGLTICPEKKVDEEKLPKVIKQYWGVDPKDEKYEYYERFVTAVASTDLFNVKPLLDFEGEELEVNLYQLTIDVMPELSGVKTTWSVESSVKWYPIMSEAGTCYVTNSLAIADNAIETLQDNETDIFPLRCEYLSLTCYVTIEVQDPTRFYIHSPYDIMDVTSSPSTVWKGVDRNTELSVIETRSGRGVRALAPRRRRCLYTDEPAGGRRVSIKMGDEEQATLEGQFYEFAKLLDNKRSGLTITLYRSDYWMRQAKMLEDRRLTMTETGVLFNKFSKSELNWDEWLAFVSDLCELKGYDEEVIKETLTNCGIPGQFPVEVPQYRDYFSTYRPKEKTLF